MKQKEYGLYDKFIDCNREEELKHEFASFLDIELMLEMILIYIPKKYYMNLNLT